MLFLSFLFDTISLYFLHAPSYSQVCSVCNFKWGKLDLSVRTISCMALISPMTTPTDIDYHSTVFRDAVESIFHKDYK
jgi:hypothetical protein